MEYLRKSKHESEVPRLVFLEGRNGILILAQNKFGNSAAKMSLPEQLDLDALQRLDPQVIGAVYDRYFPEVYRFVRFRLNDEHIAEDVASDVFVRLLEACRAGRGPQTNLKGWLLATASHIVTDHMRKSYRRPETELPESLPDGASALTADFEANERDLHLKNAMTNLTEEQQYVITLRFNQGCTLEETAELMKKNINAVKQLQFRALTALSRLLGELP